MRLASDTRGRVPFALVGVVLLVSSAAYTGALATRDPVPARTPGERALATATTAAHVALERAALHASETAAARPLTTPADSPMGAVLDGRDPFRRYLRLLVYQRAHVAFENVSARAGDRTVAPALPSIRTPADARTAIARTRIEAVADGRRLRVTLRNVTFTISRRGRTVATHRETLSVVAATPILALHRRTARFDRRLDAGPTEGAGLGRRLAAGLFLTTQARGLAQYAGAPIANVLPNRHVELQTNLAAVALQREAFGRADAGSVGATGWAVARVGVRDSLAASSVARDRWSERVLGQPPIASADAATAVLTQPAPAADARTVDASRAADRALVDVLDGGPGSVEAAVADAYTLEARLLTTTRTVSRSHETTGTRPDRAAPAGRDRETTWTVSRAPSGVVDAPPGYRVVETVGRRVVETRRVEHVWRTTTGTSRTVETTTTETRVTLGVAVRYSPAPAPDRPVDGSPAGRRLEAAAIDRLLGAPGERDRLARTAVAGTVDDTQRRVSVAPPAAVVAAARDTVVATHARTREVAATVDPARVGDRTAPGAVRRAFATNRTDLLGAPVRYDGPAAVARVAARQVYLDAVASRLAGDTSRARDVENAISGLLERPGLAVPAVGTPPVPSRSRTALSVSVTPDYLPLTAVSSRHAGVDDTTHLLAARNVNLFTVPYGDVADGIAAVLPEQPTQVDLAVAARTLAAANGTALRANESLEADRRRLRDRVRAATTVVVESQERVLARRTSLSRTERRRVVDEALDAHPTVAARALAATNGTLAGAVADRAARRTAVDRAVLAARLRVAAAETRRKSAARVTEPAVSETASSVRAVAREGVRSLASYGAETAAAAAKRRALSESMASLPAGVPVLPPPNWYLTVNVWVVDVRGAYHRVEARSTVASPSFGPDGLTYVREARPVARDVDADGERERLGRVAPVAFRVQTAVIVAVPPGPRGVGDTDGNLDERSPGWPGPPAARPSTDHQRNATGTTPPSIGSP